MNEQSRRTIEEVLGYRFSDEAVLDAAFTHVSYANENNVQSYERLEYLGDALVGFIIAKKLYERFPSMDEGSLTNMRKKVVSNEAEYTYFAPLGLGKFLRAGGKGQGENLTDNHSVVSDLFEAVVGAMSADGCPYDTIERFVLSVLDIAICDAARGASGIDYKSRLLEMCAKRGSKVEFVEKSRSGPSHAPTFSIAVMIDGVQQACAEGRSKKEAEQTAAKSILS